MPSTYYTGRVHSILGQNLHGARRRRFGHTIPVGNFGFFAENHSQDFGDFLT